jgi:hypothetical protein
MTMRPHKGGLWAFCTRRLLVRRKMRKRSSRYTRLHMQQMLGIARLLVCVSRLEAVRRNNGVGLIDLPHQGVSWVSFNTS